ncbi:MAG: MFS transporter [Promethearchaeota archaeon]
MTRKNNHDKKSILAFSQGEIGDNIAYQSFSFLVFTFYFTVVKIPISLISGGFIIWSIWNAINDPLIGYLSDRTKSKRGRRIPWMIGATIPLAVVMILLFTPPVHASFQISSYVYFLVLLFAFDTIYTCFNLNYNAAFSEQFTSMEKRSKVGGIRIRFVIVSLILAFVMPTILIDDLTNENGYPYTQMQYIINATIVAVIIGVSYFITLKWGIKKDKEFRVDSEDVPGMVKSFKITFSNKSFVIYLIPALGTWIVNGILPTMIPLWASFKLKVTEEDSIMTGILLLVAFLVAGASTPLWTKIRQKKGARYSGLISTAIWACTVILFLVPGEGDLGLGFVVMGAVGFGLGGGLYFYDQCLAEIIDEDEVRHGRRRAGYYYGIISFIIRLSGVINFIMIGLIFSGTEWSTYTPNPGINEIIGVLILLAIYPAIVLGISVVGLYLYPIKGEKLAEIRRKVDELHDEKEKRAGESNQSLE